MGLPDFVVHNLRWKLTALLLATLLWCVIKFVIYKQSAAGQEQFLRRQTVLVLRAPDDTRAFRVDPPTVDVVVKASKQVSVDDVQAFVDLARIPDVNTAYKAVIVRASESTLVVRTEPPVVMVERVSPLELPATNNLVTP